MIRIVSNNKTLTSLEPCEDTSPKCPRFVPKYCTKNKMVMENCKASCGFCSKFKVCYEAFHDSISYKLRRTSFITLFQIFLQNLQQLPRNILQLQGQQRVILQQLQQLQPQQLLPQQLITHRHLRFLILQQLQQQGIHLPL